MGTPNRLMDLSIKESSQFDYHNFVGAIIRKGMTVIIKKEDLRKWKFTINKSDNTTLCMKQNLCCTNTSKS